MTTMMIRALAVLLLASAPTACFWKWLDPEVETLEELGWTVRSLDDNFEVHKPACTDEDLADLVRLGPGLENIELDLSRTAVTNAGLLRLAKLSNIIELDVSDTAVDDVGIAVVRRWTGLKKLTARRTGVTDDGLAALTPLLELEMLILDGCTAVTGAGLSAVNSETLRYLDLSRTAIDDAGLRTLVPDVRRTLTVLQVRETRVTDASLAFLESFELLEEVDVVGVTGLSERAVQDLEKSPSAPFVVR